MIARSPNAKCCNVATKVVCSVQAPTIAAGVFTISSQTTVHILNDTLASQQHCRNRSQHPIAAKFTVDVTFLRCASFFTLTLLLRQLPLLHAAQGRCYESKAADGHDQRSSPVRPHHGLWRVCQEIRGRGEYFVAGRV